MMSSLGESQDKLHDLTSKAIEETSEKNEKLIEQQSQMLQMSDVHRTTMESNLHELMREKGLIRSGQIEVARLIAELRSKLDDNINMLKQQSMESRQNHAALNDDLNQLHENAFKISEKIGDTTEFILSQHEIAATQFDQTIRQLSEISVTVDKLLSTLHSLESDIDRKITWIAEKIGDTDAVLTNVNLILYTLAYLLLGMLVLVFIDAPPFYRIVFVVAVPLNFIFTVFNIQNLNLIQLSQVIAGLFVANFLRMLVSNFNWMEVKDKARGNSMTKESEKKETECHTREDELNHDINRNQTAYKDFTFAERFRRQYNRHSTRDRSMTPTFSNVDNESDRSRR